MQRLSQPPNGNSSKAGIQLTTNPREVNNGMAGAVKKEEPQASIKEEGDEKRGSLLLPASLEEPSFFSSSLLSLLLLLLLLLPPLPFPPREDLGPLPLPDCLPELELSCLPPLGDLDLSRLDLE